MAYKNKTIDEVYNILYEGLCSKFNQRFKLLPKSFLHVWCKVVAGLFLTGYKTTAWWGLQQYPKTAYFGNVSCLGFTINPLKMLGELYGAGNPYMSTTWKGTIKIPVEVQGDFLDSGTQLKSAVTGKLYLTTETIPLDDDFVTVGIKCTEGGTAGNLEVGDSVDFVHPLGVVAKSTTVEEVSENGTDEETEESYRNRVQIRFSTKPHGGAYADYREYASEVPGVLQTYIYGDCKEISGSDYTYTGVIIYVAGRKELYTDRIPDEALLRAVGKSCTYDSETGKMRKMLGQVIDPSNDETYKNVRPVFIKGFDVYLTGLQNIDVSDFKDSLKSTLETYFEGREPYIRGLSNEAEVLNKVTYNNILGVVNELAISVKAEFGKIELKESGKTPAIETYTLKSGELTKLENLYIDGVKV